jgi:hypothetical protein
MSDRPHHPAEPEVQRISVRLNQKSSGSREGRTYPRTHRHRAPEEPGGRSTAGDVASPRLAPVSHAAKQPAAPGRPKDRFLVPYVTGMRCLPGVHRPSRPAVPRDRGRVGDARHSDAATAGPATSSPGRLRPPQREIASRSGLPCAGWPRSRTCFLFQGSATSKNRSGSVEPKLRLSRLDPPRQAVKPVLGPVSR